MRRGSVIRVIGSLVVAAWVVAACAGSATPTAVPAPTSAPTVAPVSLGPAVTSPPGWGEVICEARAILNRREARAPGREALDAATAVLELIKKAPDWPPGSRLRKALANDAFTLMDAAGRDQQAMDERLKTLAAAEEQFKALEAAGGITCPAA